MMIHFFVLDLKCIEIFPIDFIDTFDEQIDKIDVMVARRGGMSIEETFCPVMRQINALIGQTTRFFVFSLGFTNIFV
jgi:hypothetical protein